MSMLIMFSDDAELVVRGGRVGPGGKCQSHGGHILQIPAAESRLPGYHES